MYTQDQPARTTPDLPAYHDPDGCQRVWCRHCCDWHRHGIGEGHRVAHCLPDASPYRRTGYTLVPAGPFSEVVRRGHRIRRLRRCPGCHEALPFELDLGRCPACERPLPATWRDSEPVGQPGIIPVGRIAT